VARVPSATQGVPVNAEINQGNWFDCCRAHLSESEVLGSEPRLR
jgi:hypothetical protein